VAAYGVEVLDGLVSSIDPGFTVHVAGGRTVTARRILVATGAGDDIPDLPGVRERWGRDLLHCPYCHGWEVRDQPLGVLGTHPLAVEHALLIRQWSDDVVYFTHTSELSDDERRRLDARQVRIVDGEVARLVIEDDQLNGVQLADGEIVTRAAVFVRPAIRPHPDGLLPGLGCVLDDTGFVVTDSTGRTSVPGVLAAGNAADPRAQVITAAGQGSAAAIAINNDLVHDDVANALQVRGARP
jgi:thioredoxin reductase